MNLAVDVHYALAEKARVFETWLHDRFTWSASDIYDKTCDLSDNERRTAILEGWRNYSQQNLVLLVYKAVRQLVRFVRNLEMVPDYTVPVSERDALIREYVINGVIDPAVRRTRHWFSAACAGFETGYCNEWLPPSWLRPHVRAAYLRTFLPTKEAELRASLEDVLDQALKCDGISTARAVPVSARSGRPRTDPKLKTRVAKLKMRGLPWKDIMETLNKETGITRTEGAYRKMLPRTQD